MGYLHGNPQGYTFIYLTFYKKESYFLNDLEKKTVKSIHIHLISDSVGETLKSVVKAALAQFEYLEANINEVFMVRSDVQINNVIESIKENFGIVFYTLVDVSLREKLEDTCKKLNIPYISILDPVLNTISQYTGHKISHLPGGQYVLDYSYFQRIEALNYALLHDDGQITSNIYNADIILVGVSRTSKTPTCIYLANRGYKAANIPLVLNLPVPEILLKINKPLIVGLTNSVDRLIEVRSNRILYINKRKNNYCNIDYVENELKDSISFFRKMSWPIINVSSRSVEETAAAIINLYNKKKKK